MTQEQKDLLLKDLCGRLPYGVKGMLCEDCICTLDKVWTKKGYESVVFAGDYYDVDCFKPYLFPLSSMTEEQKNECFKGTPLEIDKYGDISVKDNPYGNCQYTDLEMYLEVIDWLLKNHFDIYGLIPMGLAIDCANLNIY